MENPKNGGQFTYKNYVSHLLRLMRNLDEHPDSRYMSTPLPLAHTLAHTVALQEASGYLQVSVIWRGKSSSDGFPEGQTQLGCGRKSIKAHLVRGAISSGSVIECERLCIAAASSLESALTVIFLRVRKGSQLTGLDLSF